MKESGYFFALPRLLARCAGQETRRAELSAGEIYGFGVFVFVFACVIAGWVVLPLVRPWLLIFLPLVVWIAFLLLFYLNSLLAAVLRRLGLYRAVTNNPLQHFVIITLLTFLAALLVLAGNLFLCSLGIFWIALIALNLLALVLLRLLHAP